LVQSDYQHIISDPAYQKTFVYGNILIEPDGAGNSQICHYGGDDYDNVQNFRKGWLCFYHNTVVSARTGNTTLLRLSSDDEAADVRNNVIYVTAQGSRLALVDSAGKTIDIRNKWLKPGWVKSHSDPDASVHDSGANIIGEEPGFVNYAERNFRLLVTSPCKSGATMPAQECIAEHLPVLEYVKHRTYKERYADAVPDIGAFEYDPTVYAHYYQPGRWPANNGYPRCSPNPFTDYTRIFFAKGRSKSVSLCVVNSFGKVVWNHVLQNQSENGIRWDGRDNNGRRLPAGCYFFNLRRGDSFSRRAVILLR